MDCPTTVVLPIYNGEQTLRTLVMQILDLASTTSHQLRVVLVDDGSTDGTFEVAYELARVYPQVRVIRQPFQRGLGPALDRVRRTLDVESVIAHDGVSPIDLAELSALLDAGEDASSAAADQTSIAATSPDEARGSRRVSSMSELNARMQQAHRAVTSFRWMQLRGGIVPRRSRANLNAPPAPQPPISPPASDPISLPPLA